MATGTEQVRLLGRSIGAEVVGVDLAELDENDFVLVHRALLDYGVIAVRDQTNLTPEAQIAFSRRLGDLEIHVAAHFLLPGHPEILQISNKKSADGAAVGFEEAGRYWHSDISYVERPAMCSLLYALEIPPSDGDTMFADMYAAYDGLDGATQKRIADLTAVHSYAASFAGETAAGANRATLTDDQKAMLPEVVHPVVRSHPETGRKALFVNPGFTTRIVGLSDDDSRSLLGALFKASVHSQNIYTHKWRRHDLVIWDNRCLMHHATPYDSSYIRHMHRTTVIGDRPV